MMKFLLFVFGAVAMECADAKLWHGNDRSKETFRIFLWIAYLKRLSMVGFMLLSVLLYYVPESRPHTRKACFFLIDSIAEGLKLALLATQTEHEKIVINGRNRSNSYEYDNKVFKRDSGRSFQEKNVILREFPSSSRSINEVIGNEGSSFQRRDDKLIFRRQGNRKTSSKHRGQEGKYHRHKDYRRRLGTCFELDSMPLIRNRYRTCAVLTLNEAFPVRLEKERYVDGTYDSRINIVDRRENIMYRKEEDIIGYNDDYRPIDSRMATNYRESTSNRTEQKVSEIMTYRQQITGDNDLFRESNNGKSMIRQMQGDTIPEMSCCHESSYTSLEAEADDEYSQGEIETAGTSFTDGREIDTQTNWENLKNDEVHEKTSTTRRYFRQYIPDILIDSSGKREERSRLKDSARHVRFANLLANSVKRYPIERQSYG